MLQLLKQIESISSCRDREILGASVVAAIHEMLQPCRVALMRYVATSNGPAAAKVVQVNEDGLCMFSEAGADGSIELLDSQPLLMQAYRSGQPACEATDADFTCIHPLTAMSGSTPSGFLRLETRQAPNAVESEAVGRFLHFYCNYLNLLDYSELDTLTGLLNRKTFDEAFDRVLARSSGGLDGNGPGGEERRSYCEAANRHWLAVVDIDHFKRVNDNFGHLFGDEVLLRVANLMRSAFRGEDRLFRFGGEEFVVMLRISSRENARRALERLRNLVEQHEFPQVGTVTCSIGFTAVDPRLAPTDILGQADEALYYAKEHGRNQVGCYETLIETGLLEQHEIAAQQPEIDIDALFG